MTHQQCTVRAGVILRRVTALREPRVAEVGVAAGHLSQLLLSGHAGLHLVMVDNWLGQEQQPAAYRATGDYHAHLSAVEQARFRINATTRTRQFATRRTILMQGSVAAAATFDAASFDLVFLDADHSVVGVQADLAAWWPKVRPGGWLGGHDYAGWVCPSGPSGPRSYFGVKEAVDAWVAAAGYCLDLDADWTWWVQREAA